MTATNHALAFSPLLLIALIGAGPHPGSEARLGVAVSVSPQAYLVERLAGERVDVQVLVPPGASPATHEPSPQQVIALHRAKLYLGVGHPDFPFEKRFLAPILERSDGPELLQMVRGGEATNGESVPGDPHVWLAPDNMAAAARSLTHALERLDPRSASSYRTNLHRFLAELSELDREITSSLSRLQRRSFLVNHPAWGHFAQQYGLKQVAIEAGGKEPTARRLIALIEKAREERYAVVFVQSGFAHRSARILAGEIGARVVPIDPLAYDWPATLRRFVQVLLGDEELRSGPQGGGS